VPKTFNGVGHYSRPEIKALVRTMLEAQVQKLAGIYLKIDKSFDTKYSVFSKIPPHCSL
jgi:hypothetical protein